MHETTNGAARQPPAEQIEIPLSMRPYAEVDPRRGILFTDAGRAFLGALRASAEEELGKRGQAFKAIWHEARRNDLVQILPRLAEAHPELAAASPGLVAVCLFASTVMGPIGKGNREQRREQEAQERKRARRTQKAARRGGRR